MVNRVDKIPDPYSRPSNEKDYGTRHPRRYEAAQSTKGSTEPQQRARARVHSSSATQSIPNATPTVLTFNTVDFDNVGLYTANRFTIPSTGRYTGSWLIHGWGQWAKAAGGTVRELTIRENGTTTRRYSVIEPNLIATLDAWLLINDPIAGTYYELVANQDSGAPVNVVTAPEKTAFEIIHVW